MKGIIFTTFEDFVCDSFGHDTYEAILDATTLETAEPFVGPGNYPASDMMALVGSAVNHLGISVDEALAAFGRYSFPKLAAGVPTLMEGLDTPHQFFGALESVIHTEVRKLDPEAQPAHFSVLEDTADSILLGYTSPMGLFALVGGFIDGVADWFESPIVHELVSTDGTYAVFSLSFAPTMADLALVSAGD